MKKEITFVRSTFRLSRLALLFYAPLLLSRFHLNLFHVSLEVIAIIAYCAFLSVILNEKRVTDWHCKVFYDWILKEGSVEQLTNDSFAKLKGVIILLSPPISLIIILFTYLYSLSFEEWAHLTKSFFAFCWIYCLLRSVINIYGDSSERKE
ncbi:hypothetical protein MEG05_16090 [Vibrio aestuarianus]|uniref:hypothetical protein n=1 Tax=Vibrio aestuarianus TaxID=28171 RepID=UPI00237C66BA|nr:hypothetical protein [Vibrio aestuarianus]MDE1315579.1 hypothetical protein [Vibrio aestuarianus]